MARRTFDFPLKRTPEELFKIVKQGAEEEGWHLDGNARKGNFSDPDGLVSGAYEVRRDTVHVTIDCGIPLAFAWRKIERKLNGFFG